MRQLKKMRKKSHSTAWKIEYENSACKSINCSPTSFFFLLSYNCKPINRMQNCDYGIPCCSLTFVHNHQARWMLWYPTGKTTTPWSRMLQCGIFVVAAIAESRLTLWWRCNFNGTTEGPCCLNIRVGIFDLLYQCNIVIWIYICHYMKGWINISRRTSRITTPGTTSINCTYQTHLPAKCTGTRDPCTNREGYHLGQEDIWS